MSIISTTKSSNIQNSSNIVNDLNKSPAQLSSSSPIIKQNDSNEILPKSKFSAHSSKIASLKKEIKSESSNSDDEVWRPW